MFYVIGLDGREYGPFTAEQVKQWVAEGRANRYSRGRRDGETTWQALSEIAELTGALERPREPVPPPPPPAPTPELIAAEYVRRQPTVDLRSAFSRGWALVRASPGVLIGATLLVWIVLVGLAAVPRVGWIGGIFVNSALLGGLYLLFLRRLRGERVAASDAFAGFGPAYLSLLLAGLVSGVLTTLGFLAFIVPGIYLAVGYLFALPLAIDKRLDFWTALEVSRRVVHHQWWAFFGFAVLALLLAAAGVLAFGIGVVLAAPVDVAAMMYLYDDVFGERDSRG